MRALTALLVAIPVLVAGSQTLKNTAPESFRANGQMSGDRGGVASSIDVSASR